MALYSMLLATQSITHLYMLSRLMLLKIFPQNISKSMNFRAAGMHLRGNSLCH